MSDFATYLRRMGGLHDAIVQEIRWNPVDRTVEVKLDDLYSNFEGLPEYPGAESGSIILAGADLLQVDVEGSEPVRVYEVVLENGSDDTVVISFWPGGRMVVRYERAQFPPCRLVADA